MTIAKARAFIDEWNIIRYEAERASGEKEFNWSWDRIPDDSVRIRFLIKIQPFEWTDWIKINTESIDN